MQICEDKRINLTVDTNLCFFPYSRYFHDNAEPVQYTGQNSWSRSFVRRRMVMVKNFINVYEISKLIANKVELIINKVINKYN